jgi:hypothetical protein
MYFTFGKKPIYHNYAGIIYDNSNGEYIENCEIKIKGYADKWLLFNDGHKIAFFVGDIEFGDKKLEDCSFYILNNNWMLIAQDVKYGIVIKYEEIGEIFIGDNFKYVKLLIYKYADYKNIDYESLLIESFN